MFYITIDTSELNSITDVLKRLTSAARKTAGNLPFKMAKDYYISLTDAILNEKYSSDFPKYDKSYEKWKMREFKHLKFWLLRTDLVNSLSVFRLSATEWCGGIMPGATNSEGKPIKMYAAKNEVKRPVFKRVREDYMVSGMVLQHKNALKELSKAWVK